MLKIVATGLILTLILCLGLLSLTYFYPSRLVAETKRLSDDFESQIELAEAEKGPTPNTDKKIFWAFSDKRKTPVSLVYIHGFSASRQEISPVPEALAQKFGYNLFMTRLTGHGLGAEGMLEATKENLLNDAEEAFAVAKKMGERVVLIGTSTGAILSLYLSHKYKNEVSAQVFYAPIFHPKRWDAFLLNGPLGPWFSKIFIGDQYKFVPKNEMQKKYWTSQYSARALCELIKLIYGAKNLRLEEVQTPTLVVYTDDDEIVDVPLILSNFNRLGAVQKELRKIMAPNHILAGEIMSPETTAEVIFETDKFIRSVH